MSRRPLWRSGARGREAGGAGVAAMGTLAVHLAAVAVLVAAPPMLPRRPPPVYRVELVAAPRPEPERRRAPEAVQRPAERPAPTERTPRRTVVAETPPPPQPAAEQRELAPRTTPEEAPVTEPSTGTDVATVKVSGIAFPFPEYLQNVVAQVYRRWQRPSGTVSLRAEILFFIHRDGSISNLRFVRRSGSFAFDLEAQGAIEATGTAKAFGPLPPGYPAGVLPVSFFFDPSTTR